MARLVCKGCHTLLMYSRGATSVQCSCCRTVNSASKANQTAHINCGNCRVLLMYQCGAHSVKCTLCNFVTSASVGIQRKNTWNNKACMVDKWHETCRCFKSAMEKLSNLGSVAKEKLKICRAKLDEKVEKPSVKTVEGRKILKEKRKAVEAEAKRELHEAKARHAAHKLRSRNSHVLGGGHLHHQPPVLGGAATHLAGANVPAYPIASQNLI